MSIEFKCREVLKEKKIDLINTVDLKSIRAINKVFRENDDSHLAPIRGQFNATERAIRWYRRVMFRANGPCSNLEYILGLEHKISEIVNNTPF